MRKVFPQSRSSIKPFPYNTMSRSPRIIESVRLLTLSTIVVISGCSFRSAFTKLFLDGKTGVAATIVTIISRVARAVRTCTYRRTPVPRSSS